MTTATTTAPPADGAVGGAPVSGRPSPPPPVESRQPKPLSVALQVSIALGLLGALAIGFAGYLYGLSGLSEQRAQHNLGDQFAHALAQAVAPVGPAPSGTPVAALDIPRLGLNQVIVVEGTSARDMTEGPGHRADTVLPGQAGVSVIYGRRVTFGAPFAHLMQLQVGDKITATTGQGVATYRVSSFGDATNPAPANSANRLVLATADSSGVPNESISLSADLTSTPQTSGGVAAVGPNEASMAGEVDASLLPALLWSQLLLALAIVTPIAAHRWSPLATYLCAAPVAMAVLWNLYENLACMLPNLY
jgi:sortase (surface protein transpeptidase)